MRSVLYFQLKLTLLTALVFSSGDNIKPDVTVHT